MGSRNRECLMVKQKEEKSLLLLEGSLRAIPFNIVLSSLLAAILLYHDTPVALVGFWLFSIVLVSLIRWFFCFYVIRKGLLHKSSLLITFVSLTLLMGTVWGASYWLTLPYLSQPNEFIVILVLGGMSAGSIASLSAYLPAYYAYIIPMFLPVIAYNFYIMNPDRAILALMFLLFIIMLIISAILNHRLLNQSLLLSNEKEKLIDKLHLLSITDPLTGAYNRRHFQSILEQELSKKRTNQSLLTLILVDVDNFKEINDKFGHPHGDRVLIETVQQLKKAFRREHDRLFRLGGDEFCIVLNNQSVQEIISLCQELVKIYPSNHMDGSFITLSIGILPIPVDSKANYDRIISSVDNALYKAKQSGKAKIVTFQSIN